MDEYEGMVINLSEMRLYYFFKNNMISLVTTFSIGIGSEGNDTPVGNFRVIEKIVNPSWHVPESVRKKFWTYLKWYRQGLIILSALML